MRWWNRYASVLERLLGDFKKKCTLGNFLDLGITIAVAISNVVMSTTSPVFTVVLTASAIGLSYGLDVMSNRGKIGELRKFRSLLSVEAEGLEQRYPVMSRGKWILLVISGSCLGLYTVVSLFGDSKTLLWLGDVTPWIGGVAVIGATTIFHLAKKVYNSPLAAAIAVAESRLDEVVKARLPLVGEQETQVKIIADLRAEKERLVEQFQKLQNELDNLGAHYRVLVEEKAVLQRQLNANVETTHKLQELIDGLTRQNTELSGQLDALQIENSQLRDEEIVLRRQLKEAKGGVARLTEMLKSKDMELLGVRSQCQSLQEALGQERARSSVLEEELQTLTRNASEEMSAGPRG